MNKNRMSHTELEEELEYNIWRKEELKRKVEKLESKLKEKSDETEDLRMTNFRSSLLLYCFTFILQEPIIDERGECHFHFPLPDITVYN